MRAFGDILVPLSFSAGGAWLLDVRGSADDDSEQEFNLGLVRRWLIPERGMILGVNAYYDSRWTRHDNHFNQLGLGVEMLSRWVDARANYYLPEHKEELVDRLTNTTVETENRSWWSDPYARGHRIRQKHVSESRTITTRRLYERREQAREGYDCEVGVRLPLPGRTPETRVFGGYYHWDAEYTGDDDIEGFRGRVEIRALSSLFLDAAWYEDEELNGAHWFFGGRLWLPLDLSAIPRGRNPFARAAGARRAGLRERLLEMVMRDPKIRVEDSGYREDLSAREVSTNVVRSVGYHTLLDDVTFVDGDNNSGDERGTAERPYNTVQEGADHAFGRSNVYVFAASGSYRENVVLHPGTTLIGEGHAIHGYGGKSFGGRRRPVLDGGGTGPSVSLADGCTMEGFRVINTSSGGHPMNDPIFGISGYERVGVYAGNADDFVLADNIIEDCSRGGLFVANGMPLFGFDVEDNLFRNNDQEGLYVRSVGSGGDFYGVFSGNVYEKNGGHGLYVDAGNSGNVFFDDDGDAAYANGIDGLYFSCLNDFAVMGMLDGVTAEGNTSNGIEFASDGYLSYLFGSRLTAITNGAAGISITPQGWGIVWTMLSDLLAAENGGDGVYVDSNNPAGSIFVSIGPPVLQAMSVAAEIESGAVTNARQLVEALALLDAGSASLAGNGGDGLHVISASIMGPSTVALSGCGMLNNWLGGAEIYNFSASNNVLVGLLGVTADGTMAGSGAILDTFGGQDSGIGIDSSRFTANAQYGLLLSPDAAGNAGFYSEHTTVADNSLDGIYIQSSGTAAGYQLDLGNGDFASVGMNSLYGNTGVDLNNTIAGSPAKIEDNFWGGAAPVAGVDYVGADDPGAHWLADDPNL